MSKLSLHHLEQKKDTERSFRWKSFKGAVPFLALIFFIFAAGGIFYSVERKLCKTMPQTFGKNQNSTCSSGLYAVASYWESVHFVVTTITTIGYGDVTPCSQITEFLAVLFAIIGMPLMLVCLAQIGRWLEHALNRLWIRVRFHSTFNAGTDYGNSVPLTVGLSLTIGWICLCSIYFYFTLKTVYATNTDISFNYWTACYFSIITFLTIGYGDVAPKNYDTVIPTYLMIFVGLALVTMCVDIMQTKMENMFDNVVELIQKEYKKNVTTMADGKGTKMATDRKAAGENVTELLGSTGDGRYFANILNKRQRERLLQEYQKQANKSNKAVQATVDTFDCGTAMEIKKEGVDMAVQAYRPVWQRRLEKKYK